ncbi:MAG: diguanylate cyclase [Thalassotalea sp.]
MIKYLILFIPLIFSNLLKAAENPCQKTIKIQMLESKKDHLIHDLLALSLNKQKITTCIKINDVVMTDKREIIYVKEDLLDLTWASGSSIEANKHLMPIRIPIFKGLLGYRIAVIRSDEQHRFDNIKSLADLRNFTAGLGKHWGDTEVFHQNNLPVVTSGRGRHLWPMLSQKRFDYLPLGAHEPWSDLALRPELNLAAEKNLLLVYPSALYFYINKNNTELFQLLSQGMKNAIEDGSYDQRLQQSAIFKVAVEKANIAARKVIHIPNANFHQNTPASHLKYWLPADKIGLFLQ